MEVTPPASVWEGIRRARDDRDRGALWWTRSSFFLLLALILGGSAMHFAMTGLRNDHGQDDHGNSIAALIPVPAMDPVAPGTNDRIADQRKRDTGAPVLSDGNQKRIQEPLHRGLASTSSNELEYVEPENGSDPVLLMDKPAQMVASIKVEPGALRTEHRGSESDGHSTDQASLRITKGPIPSVAEKILDDADIPTEGPQLLPTRSILLDRMPRMAAPLQAIPAVTYVLCPSEWWVGVHMATYSLGYGWVGENERLVNALNEVEAPTSTLALALTSGKEWKSGWGLSAGVAFERSEQAFRLVERTVQFEQQIETYLVTLDTQVFVSSIDTSNILVSNDQVVSRGSARRSHVRVPVEAFWHTHVGRWTVGPRAGMALEFVTGNEGTLLIPDANDGSLGASSADASLWGQRYPASLIGIAGLDIGFDLNERWSLDLRPRYMQALHTFQGPVPAEGSVQRWGIQFGVIHHLMKECSK